jgi:putative transposase
VLRFLFVALAFILVNLWVYLLWGYVSRLFPEARLVYQNLFPLKTMLEFLAQALRDFFCQNEQFFFTR